MPWQHRIGSREPLEEVVEGCGTHLLHGAREPHAVRTQPVPRDLVDEHRIEVVNRGIPIAVERIGRDGGERRGDLRERRLHALVERRAPERMPPAAPVVEIRVDEAFDDRALRQLDESEDRPCASARRRLARRRVGQANQLLDVEAAGRKAVTGQRELRDRRLPEPELASRQRAIGVANEEDRRRILLPDDLQRRVHGCAVLGHQPFKVTAKDDTGVPRTVLACSSSLWLTPPDTVSDLRRKKEIEMARARRQPKRILNCIPSRERDEDWRIDTAEDAGVVAAAPRIPPKKDLRQTWWRINDQGTTGSCVGWGCADGCCAGTS